MATSTILFACPEAAAQPALPVFGAALIDALPASVALVDGHGMIFAVNRRWRLFAGANGMAAQDQGVGASYFDACAAAADAADATQARQAAQGIRDVAAGVIPSFSMVYPCHSPDQERWFQIDAARLESGATRGVVVMHTNISERERTKLQIEALSHIDSLTGLPNHHVMRARLEEAVIAAQRSGRKLAIMFVGIDRFATLNETLGHQAGDGILREIAHRLRQTVRPCDSVGRTTGDEFGVLLPGIDGASQVESMARLLIEAAARPVNIDGSEIYLTVSIGISLFPDDAPDPKGLLGGARAAMRHAKDLGRNGFQFTTGGMNAASMERTQLEAGLRIALPRNEFILHYQPKADCRSGRITGVEALLRWRHPERGLVSPADFIPALEATGLIVPVGVWTLRTACAQAREWRRQGLAPISVAVNLSGRQLLNGEIVNAVREALESSHLTPDCLELELTESYLMQDPESAIATLTELKKLGVRISVDDFGTGYSSLAYLKKFPLDTLKIDRAFVKDISVDPDDASITRAIIDLAHQLGLSVVAEGVETAAQLGLLTANHCDSVQGYYLSPPVDAAGVVTMLREDRRLAGTASTGEKRPRTLLLVDDEENIRNALKRLLRRSSYRVLTADSGTEGLRLMAEQPVDVVLSDQRMPGMTGVDFLRRAKQIHPHSVRIVLSGYTELQSVTDAINEGAIYKFLTKPWDDALLLANIDEAFRRKEMGDENRRLEEEVKRTNAELSQVNQQLTEHLRTKSQQAARTQNALGAAHEALQHVPLPLLGVDTDGQIALANGAAEAWLSAGQALLGRFADEVLPADLAAWLASGAQAMTHTGVNGVSCRVSRRQLGESSGAAGTLIIIEPEAAPI